MPEPRELTLRRAAEEMRGGRLSAVRLLESCLERIHDHEGAIQAWARLYDEEALVLAQELDRLAARQEWRGPLHGLPLGIKDIFDVKDQVTAAGTAAYPARVAEQDAVSVARLRNAGAILLGKTVTTAFAMGDPGPTRNPWKLSHTPGGSSSGSAAAVADRMCPGALGTQTNGSVIRPASFNGIIGFKPGLGRIPTAGVLPLSWQLDHVGTLTRSVEDAHLLWNTLGKETAGDKLPDVLQPRAPKRIWRLREYFEDEADPEILSALDEFCEELAGTGTEIVERRLPSGFTQMHNSHHIIMASEAASVHRRSFAENPTPYPPKITGLIRAGLDMQAVDYVEALHHRQHLIEQISASMADVDAAIFPAAPGPAPVGLEATGNPGFNTLSSICGLPVVAIPAAVSSQGLPLGLQLLGHDDREEDLLRLGAWCEGVLSFDQRPSLA